MTIKEEIIQINKCTEQIKQIRLGLEEELRERGLQMDNGFSRCCPSGNTLIDAFNEPKPKCQVCEDISDMEADKNGDIICSYCRQDAEEEGCNQRGY